MLDAGKLYVTEIKEADVLGTVERDTPNTPHLISTSICNLQDVIRNVNKGDMHLLKGAHSTFLDLLFYARMFFTTIKIRLSTYSSGPGHNFLEL